MLDKKLDRTIRKYRDSTRLILLSILTNPKLTSRDLIITSNLSKNSVGGALSALSKNDIISPQGRVGAEGWWSLRWSLSEEVDVYKTDIAKLIFAINIYHKKKEAEILYLNN